MISKWLEKRRQDKLDQEKILANLTADQRRQNEQGLADVKVEVIKSNDDMTSKPCSINDMQLCNSKCVHFNKASYYGQDVSIFLFGQKPPHGPIMDYVLNPAKCKLWRN